MLKRRICEKCECLIGVAMRGDKLVDEPGVVLQGRC